VWSIRVRVSRLDRPGENNSKRLKLIVALQIGSAQRLLGTFSGIGLPAGWIVSRLGADRRSDNIGSFFNVFLALGCQRDRFWASLVQIGAEIIAKRG